MLKLHAQCVCECVKPSMVENGGKELRLPQREEGEKKADIKTVQREKNRHKNSTDS